MLFRGQWYGIPFQSITAWHTVFLWWIFSSHQVIQERAFLIMISLTGGSKVIRNKEEMKNVYCLLLELVNIWTLCALHSPEYSILSVWICFGYEATVCPPCIRLNLIIPPYLLLTWHFASGWWVSELTEKEWIFPDCLTVCQVWGLALHVCSHLKEA